MASECGKGSVGYSYQSRETTASTATLNDPSMMSGSRPTYGDKKILELPYQVLKDLCDVLDVDDRWKSLGGKIGVSMTELLNIHQKYRHTSCTMKIDWSLKNPTVAQLFQLLAQLRMYQPMSLLKNHVSPSYHHLLVNPGGHEPAAAVAAVMAISSREPVESGDYFTPCSEGCVDSGMASGMNFLPRPPLPPPSLVQQDARRPPGKMDTHDVWLEEPRCSEEPRFVLKQADGFACASKCEMSMSQEDKSSGSTPLSSIKKGFVEEAQASMKPSMSMSYRGFPPSSHQHPAPPTYSSIQHSPVVPPARSRPVVDPQPVAEKVDLQERFSTVSVKQKSSVVEEKPSVGLVSVDAIVGRIPYEEIVQATKNFTTEELGRGGFGVVYEGLWKKLKVAIKKIENKTPGAPGSLEDAKLVQSYVELKTLNQCRYDNVLSLYGYAEGYPEGASKDSIPPILCLVYQFMVNGSLEDRLLRRGGTEPLSWPIRLIIARGSARGLQYLHTCDPRIIHGDIKSANILLDINFEPKLGDFGLARFGPAAECTRTSVNVTAVHGTKPYLPDEFLRSHQLSTKVDTYSFGVVLLELATGLRAFVEARSKNLREVVKNYDTSKYEELRDLSVGGGQQVDDCGAFMLFIHEGIRCTKSKKNDRPEMTTVFEDLDHFVKLLQDQVLESINTDDDVGESSQPPPYSSVASGPSQHNFGADDDYHRQDLSGNGEEDEDDVGRLPILPILTVLGTKPPST